MAAIFSDRRKIVWTGAFLAVASGLGLGGWALLATSPEASIKKTLLQHLPPGTQVEWASMTSLPNGALQLQEVRLQLSRTGLQAKSLQIQGDAIEAQGVRVQGEWGVIAADRLEAVGVDWSLGLAREVVLHQAALAESTRSSAVGAKTVRLGGVLQWTPTLVEMEDLEIRQQAQAMGRPLHIKAQKGWMSIDGPRVQHLPWEDRLPEGISSFSMQTVQGTWGDQPFLMESLASLIRRWNDRRVEDMTLEVKNAVVHQGPMMAWFASLGYEQVVMQMQTTLDRRQTQGSVSGRLQIESAGSWEMMGRFQEQHPGLLPNAQTIGSALWTQAQGAWTDEGLVLRLQERARVEKGLSMEGLRAQWTETLYQAPFLAGILSAKEDLRRWLEKPTRVQVEAQSAPGLTIDTLTQSLSTSRPPSLQLRLMLR